VDEDCAIGNIILRASELTSIRCPITRTWEGNAKQEFGEYGSSLGYWREPASPDEVAFHSLEESSSERASSSNLYREGFGSFQNRVL